MIDTLGFFIQITKDAYEVLKSRAVHTQRLDQSDGEVHFEYFNLDLYSPSWNQTVRWWISDFETVYDRRTKQPEKLLGRHNLKVEFSAPKLFYGHNLYSIDMNKAYKACKMIRVELMKQFNIFVPLPYAWYPYRIDVCANFILDTPEQTLFYMRHIQKLEYPRRMLLPYPNESLHSGSRDLAFKIYRKGPEFKKHDAQKFQGTRRDELQELASRIVRVEVEFKRILKRTFKEQYCEITAKIPKTFNGYLSLGDLLQFFDPIEELKKVMRKLMNGQETGVTRLRDIKNVLYSRYSKKQADSFHHVYFCVTTHGKQEAKEIVGKDKYYRALRAFRDNNISLLCADVEVDEKTEQLRGFPADFSLEINKKNIYYQLC